MSMRRFVVLLIAALAVIAGAMYLSSQRYLERDPRGGAFMPDLHSRLDAITEISIRKGTATPGVTLERVQSGDWTVSQRNGYPVDVSKVRHLLLALDDAKVAEEKTSNPASYEAIGVEDPTAPSAGGVEVALKSPNLTSAIILGHASGNGTFARRVGEAKSYLIEPAVSVDTTPHDWIDSKLLDIPLEKIRAIETKLPDATSYSISRATAKQPKDPNDKSGADAKDSDFVLAKVPAGREAADPATVGPSSTTYSGITADEVARVKDVDFSKPSSVVVSLFDGGKYTLTGVASGDKHWISINASNDPSLTTKTKDRAFEIVSYRYDAIFRPLEQLLKPKPEKPKASKQSASKSANSKSSASKSGASTTNPSQAQ